MIAKLRKKLIFVSMVSLFIVLFVLILSIGILNYRKLVTDADHVLSIWQKITESFRKEKNRRNRQSLKKIFLKKTTFFRRNYLMSQDIFQQL